MDLHYDSRSSICYTRKGIWWASDAFAVRVLLSVTVDTFIKKANSTEIVFPFYLPFWYIAEKIFISISCQMSHFYQNLFMTKVCFLLLYTGNSVQTHGKRWQMALGSQSQSSRSRIRPLTLHAHINTVRIQRESAATRKVKVAAHTSLCMPFKLVITFRLPETKYAMDCSKRYYSQFCFIHSYMKISD